MVLLRYQIPLRPCSFLPHHSLLEGASLCLSHKSNELGELLKGNSASSVVFSTKEQGQEWPFPILGVCVYVHVCV